MVRIFYLCVLFVCSASAYLLSAWVHDVYDVDLVRSKPVKGYVLDGFGGVEGDVPYRWGFGPESKVAFMLHDDREVIVSFALSNPIPDQGVVVTFNDKVIKEYSGIAAQQGLDPWVTVRVKVSGRKGLNTLTFSYRRWNMHNYTLTEADKRGFAVRFTKLSIYSPDR